MQFGMEPCPGRRETCLRTHEDHVQRDKALGSATYLCLPMHLQPGRRRTWEIIVKQAGGQLMMIMVITTQDQFGDAGEEAKSSRAILGAACKAQSR